ncbi:hypothetical protein AAHB54_08180, partial [Bacillus cereus]
MTEFWTLELCYPETDRMIFFMSAPICTVCSRCPPLPLLPCPLPFALCRARLCFFFYFAFCIYAFMLFIYAMLFFLYAFARLLCLAFTRALFYAFFF